MKLPTFHWHRLASPGFPIEMPGLSSHRLFRWRGIHGVQIGSWFIGAIEGDREATPSPALRSGGDRE